MQLKPSRLTADSVRNSYYLLKPPQRMFLNSLQREDVQTIGQAFRCAGIPWSKSQSSLERWMDDVAFEEVLFSKLRSMPRVRRDQVFDTICEFLRRQPLRKICDIPHRRSERPSGWHARPLNISRPPRVKRRSNIFSESGADPWK